MTIVHFDQQSCQRVLRYLDSYLDNELLVETNHEVVRHLETCAACTAEVETRLRVRTALRAAVRQSNAPAGLSSRIQRTIRDSESHSRMAWGRWMLAAALVVISAGVWFEQRPSHASAAALLQVGLSDHIHCAVPRKYPPQPPPLEKFAQDMGPDFAGLVPLVKTRLPQEMCLEEAHRCTVGDRHFVHMILRDPGTLLSVIITRKRAGESLANTNMLPVARRAGVSIYTSNAARYPVATFETERYLVFVISNMDAGRNLEMAAAVAPSVREFLSTRESS